MFAAGPQQIEKLEAILFDFDGTLTEPGCLDFPAIKRKVGCPPEEPVLEFIAGLRSSHKKRSALETLERFESRAAKRSRPNAGAGELIRDLRAAGFPIGIISRNRLSSILEALTHFQGINPADFKVIISRDDYAAAKPDPAGVLQAARKMQVEAEKMLVVGDFVFDMEAGQQAGAPTAFLTNGAVPPSFKKPPDFIIDRVGELKGILRYYQPLPAGKLPGDLLSQFLEEYPVEDPSLLVGPRFGEDTAVVKTAGQEAILVLKSDPITFTTRQLGRYAVLVNANDVATSGALPRWLLTTLLFPSGSSAAQIHSLMRELQQVSREFGLTLCGGHTEITSTVTQPIVIGHVVGTVTRERLIDKRNLRTGDRIILSKPIAVEGTSLLARDFSHRLKVLGMGETQIRSCQRFLLEPGISVLKEAALAARHRGVSAMHDVTEGGLSAALEELSAAGGHRIRVFLNQIPVFPETRRLCRLLGLDPLGLIGSGSLLIACRPGSSARLMKKLKDAGIPSSCIGEALGEGTGVQAFNRRGREVEWPRFATDELARALTTLNDQEKGQQEE